MSGAVPGDGVFRHIFDFPLRRIRIGHGHGFFHFGHALLHGALWVSILGIIVVVVVIALIISRLARRSRRPF